jgi:broad specificity phosphatase PhoE
MNLYLVRHGECHSESAPGVFTPDGGLSAVGERQACMVAERLAALNITHVLSSPLLRALATASAIAEAAGALPVEVWTGLREGYGDMPGIAVPIHRCPGRSELLRRFPRVVLPADITEDGWEHGGDNSYPAFSARCATVARLLTSRFVPDDRVVVVGHGGCLNYVLHALLGIPAAAPVWFQMELGAISTLRLVPERERRQGWPLYPPVGVELLNLNDRSHLQG